MAAAQERSLEETFDALVCRPLGKRVALALVRTRMTANQVSGLAALSGSMAGAAFALPAPYPAYGSLFLFAMMVLDCADGEIARIRGGGGWRGRVLDGLADLATAFAVHLGMLLHMNRAGGVWCGLELTPSVNFVLALFAGLSMTWRSGLLDDVKQRLKPTSIDRELAAYASEPKTALERLLFWTITSYVKSIKRYGGKRRPGGYACFRRAQIVGPTHIHLVMVICGLAICVMPQTYVLFFVASIVPMNLYMLAVLCAACGAESEDVTSGLGSEPR